MRKINTIKKNDEFLKVIKNGKYIKENSTLIVSRGLGNSSFPIRINNPIELVLVTLKKETTL